MRDDGAPALPGRADAVIIGGGIVGCATAWFLAKQGLAPLVVEKEADVAVEQSGRNWGFVRQQGRDPAELPLMMASNRIWLGLEKELEADLGWHRGGIMALTDDEAMIERYERWVATARGMGLETGVVGADEIDRLIPGMGKRWKGGLFTPGDGNADPDRVTHAFRAALERRGGRVVTGCCALGIETMSGRVAGVATDRGTVASDTVVVAAGAWSATVLGWLGLRLPQQRLRATVARTRPMARVTDVAAWGPDLAFAQRRDGCFTLALGDVSDVDARVSALGDLRYFWPAYRQERHYLDIQWGEPFWRDLRGLLPGSAAMRDPMRRARVGEPQANPRKVARSLELFGRWFPGRQGAALQKSWAGHIEMTPDMLPVIEALERPAGLVVATGFSGHGFGIGPGAGAATAALATNTALPDGLTPADVAPFRLARYVEGAWGPPFNLV